MDSITYNVSYEFPGHPLYLRIILDEVRVFGVYEKLDEELSVLLSSKGVIELYTFIIKRWKLKFDKKGGVSYSMEFTAFQIL